MIRRLRVGLLAFALLGVLATACSNPGKEGELSNGGYSASCEWATCDSTADKCDLPPVFALGTSVRVIYQGALDDQVRVVPCAPARATLEGDHIRFNATGYTALLSRSDKGEVSDLLHARVVRPESIELRSAGTLSVGAVQRVQAVLRSSEEDLAGLTTFKWTTEPVGIVSIASEDDKHTLEVRGVSPGKVKFTAEALGLKGELNLEVAP